MADMRYDSSDAGFTIRHTDTNSSLHEKAKACKPDVPLKPTTILVALLKPERGNEGPKSEDDFFWVKCTGVSVVVV